jgi:hypothetical protein
MLLKPLRATPLAVAAPSGRMQKETGPRIVAMSIATIWTSLATRSTDS